MRHLNKIFLAIFLLTAAGLVMGEDNSSVKPGEVDDSSIDRYQTSCCNVEVNDDARDETIVKDGDLQIESGDGNSSIPKE